MSAKRSELVLFGAIFLLVLAGCKGGDTSTGAPTTPFLGGTRGLEISFLEGSPPDEVTDGDTFDFQAVVKLRNQGEADLKKGQVNISLIGFLPSDFRSNLNDFSDSDLINKNPDDDLLPRKKDSEGNIIESVETFKTFPKDDKNFKFKNTLDGNTVFILRADVCYAYHTDALSEICVLENMVDVPDDSICDPSETKTIFSSGSPVQITGFRQNVAGKNKLQFSFDIEHSGSGKVFEQEVDAQGNVIINCPKSASDRRTKEDEVVVNVTTGLKDVDGVAAAGASLRCTGLNDKTDVSESSGPVKLVNGKRTITCTQELAPDRTDFKKSVGITVDFNYLDSADKEILVKHLVSDS